MTSPPEVDGDVAGAAEPVAGLVWVLGTGTVAAEPSPTIPPVAPVAAILASASASVVQAIDVPGELTNGSAAHVSPVLQADTTNDPPTH